MTPYLDLLDFIPLPQRAAVADGTGVYADEALADAIDYGVYLGCIPEIRLPAGRLQFARTVHLKNTVRLHGHGVGQAGQSATVLQFDADRSGIVVHRHDTGPNGLEDAPTTGANGSVIEGVRLEGAGKRGHGVWMRARATVQDCQIDGFGEDGVRIVADVRSSDPFRKGNANNWCLETVLVTNCGGHGLYLDGGDVNVGRAMGLSVTSNGGWGVYDSGFLGNTYIGCHASNNALGPYKTDNRNARHVFVGCYSEGNQTPSVFSHTTLLLGGLHGAGADGGQRIANGNLTPFKVRGVNGRRAVTYRLGVQEGAGLDVVAEGDHPNGWSLGFWDEGSKTVQFRHARLDAGVVLSLTTALSTAVNDETGDPIGPGEMLVNSVWAPAGNNRFRKIDLLDLLRRIEALESS